MLVVAFVCAVGCGGGGGGGGDGGGGGGGTLYVRTTGDDGNDGRSPATALRTVGAAAARVRAGGRVIVGPGVHRGAILDPATGRDGQPVVFLADPTGVMTEDATGQVVVDATGIVEGRDARPVPALRLSRAAFVTVDGFAFRHASTAGVQVRSGSNAITIRNCQMSANSGDGILVQDSSDVLVFNNLVVDNTSRGIVIAGTARATVVNNTVARNRGDGLDVRARSDEAASSDTFLRNNVLQNNGGQNVQVSSGLDTFDSGFNLVFPDSYEPAAARARTDLAADALFVNARSGNFRLSQRRAGEDEDSPAVDAGVEENPADGPAADYAALVDLSTASDRSADRAPIDLGYHYPPGADIPPPRPPVLYVRASRGNDANDGGSPATALKTIAAAVEQIEAGDTVIVGPGTYAERILDPRGGSAAKPVTFVADRSGRTTGDREGAVVLDNRAGTGAVVRISGVQFVTVDGFVLTGGAAGAHVRAGAANVAIQHCEILANPGDGILVQNAEDVLLFNNLVYGNDERGVALAGAPRGRLINNTIVGNGGRGVFLGIREADGSEEASPDAFLRNNIIQDNGATNLQADPGPPSSVEGFDAQFNLVFPDTYVPDDLPRAGDVNEDALFAEPERDDYRLVQSTRERSPAVDAGVTDQPPSGPAPDYESLRDRTTSPTGRADSGTIDLGYHYPR